MLLEIGVLVLKIVDDGRTGFVMETQFLMETFALSKIAWFNKFFHFFV